MSTSAAAVAIRDAMFKKKRWAVAGDILNSTKPAHDVAKRLSSLNYSVTLINPKIKVDEKNPDTLKVHTAISSSDNIDVLDLCINSYDGLKLLEQAKDSGVKSLFIQPGAESEEILKLAKESGMDVYQGCVLRELKESKL